MTIITFIYENNQFTKIDNDKNKLLIHILFEYSSIINKDIKELYFMINGKKLNFKNKEKISNLEKDNVTIIVLNLKKKENKELNQIICPECKNMAILNFDGDKILLNNCINKHSYIHYSMNEFMKNQIVEELKCDSGKNDKYLYNDKFYICSCKKNICQLCAKSHDRKHKMIKYNDKFYKCIKHNDNFISYCNNCYMNLYEKCEEMHDNKHKIILFKEKKPNEKK